MRKIILICICLYLFFITYQVRISFLETYDYNIPSDSKEYMFAIPGALGTGSLLVDIVSGKGISQPISIVRHNIGVLNTHGTPLYITYIAALSVFNLTPQSFAPFLHAAFISGLFLVAVLLFPLWIAFIIAGISIFYTPLFAFIFSWMPENFTVVSVPLFTILASFLVMHGRKWYIFLLAGLSLALVGFSRHVFTFFGIFFILLWFFTAKGKLKKIFTISIIVGYLLPTLLWLSAVKWSDISPYSSGTYQSALYRAHTLETDGWALDPKDGLTWTNVFYHIVSQNILDQILLQMERINRFLRNPANSYTGSFPFSWETLNIIHLFLLFFTAFGLRSALKNKFFALAGSAFVWNVFFVSQYYIEEVRLQMPTIVIMFLLSGAGIKEVLELWTRQQTKIVIPFFLLAVLIITFSSDFPGFETWFFPFLNDSRIWRAFHILLAFLIMVIVTGRLWSIDKKASVAINHPIAVKILSLMLFFVFLIFSAPYLRSKIWHEWATPLMSGSKIEQRIFFSPNQLDKLADKNGYLLIDIKDSNSAQDLVVKLNGKVLMDSLSMREKTSGVDLMAVRQWQRSMPRLGGFFSVEPYVASASAWPNMRGWLVFPIDGLNLKKENSITVENTNRLSFYPPLIYGDYPPFGSKNFYEGPTPRIFQGHMTHNKYQIDQDMRLTEERLLYSRSNTSKLILSNGKESLDDLSTYGGKQKGRYRIFFLFPYTTGDPEDIF